jgi:hypothetical protein
VYSWTRLAPAATFLYASSPLSTPPTPSSDNRQLHSNAKEKRRKTVENSFPFLVVATDNFTALRKKKEEKQWKILFHS